MKVSEVTTQERCLFTRLPQLAQRWRAGELDAASYGALYFLYGQFAVHGSRSASRRHKTDPRPDVAAWRVEIECSRGEDLRELLLHYLERHHYLGVIPNVPAALCAWLRGVWQLRLCETVPHPREVLRAQARGERPVTVIADYPRLLQPVLTKPNARAFMLHDLEHAYKFCAEPALHAGQRAFFQKIEEALAQGRFAQALHDAVFATKFTYLISDMNTHPAHSLHYLRAILIEYHLRREHRPLHAPCHRTRRCSWRPRWRDWPASRRRCLINEMQL